MKTSQLHSINPREIGMRAVLEFQWSHNPPDEILNRLIGRETSPEDKALAWELALGTIRHLKKIDYILQSFIKARLSTQKPEVLAGLRIGLYQLLEISNIPQFAAVDQTVKLFSSRGFDRDAGFVNAVLRNYLREPEKIKYPDPIKKPAGYLSTLYSYPEWLVKRWLSRYGYLDTTKMLIANNERPGMSFKILSRKSNAAEVMENLQGQDIDLEKGKYFLDFISSTEGMAVIRSELFEKGNLIVQDESQAIPIYLLDPPEGETVLDLCAAPGGKTIALADRVGPNGRVIAVEIDEHRLGQLIYNVRRVDFDNVDFVREDALKFAPGMKFKYILLDVPCSALGTISHNVDLKWTKSENDIKNHSKLQSSMLARAAELVDDNGSLVYSTCTTEPEEIENVIEGFLKGHGEFEIEYDKSGKLSQFEASNGIYRSWPHVHGIGGGGFALLRRKNGQEIK